MRTAALAMLFTCCPLAAAAQPAGSQASAEALFQEGKRLLEIQAFEQACPKLAESYRLDPATGTLLALALCYEKANRLATAWATYNDAASRAANDGNAAREKAARDRAQALAPRMSRLTIDVAPAVAATPGLAVTRGGVPVGAGSFGTPLPVDGGAHTIEAAAPGRATFRVLVRVRDERDAQRVSITALEAAPTATEAPAAGAGRGLGPLQIGGIVSAGVGLVALGVGTGFAVHAMGRNAESNENGCNGNRCDPIGTELRNSAISAANVASAMFVAGGVLTAAGVTLFIVGRPSKSAPSLQTAPAVGPSRLGWSVSGRF
jgi:hypothetical protein